ncbi:MAG TPA: histidine kinase dimerization/phospho-acceptor domain-containing protein [Verrucomicrobiae bacterium]|nr:histidine kinase dimerization/phospho-acceptor domain-containing protein [Verrucomicrobiae bacterium]
MPLPTEPLTLSAEQIAELNRNLSDLRHDINNNVALILSAIEMMRRRPETFEKMLDSMARQPQRITETVAQFSKALETALKITRP